MWIISILLTFHPWFTVTDHLPVSSGLSAMVTGAPGAFTSVSSSAVGRSLPAGPLLGSCTGLVIGRSSAFPGVGVSGSLASQWFSCWGGLGCFTPPVGGPCAGGFRAYAASSGLGMPQAAPLHVPPPAFYAMPPLQLLPRLLLLLWQVLRLWRLGLGRLINIISPRPLPLIHLLPLLRV